MTKEITVDLLVEDEAVREQYMDRVDVLDKVKKLLLLPELDMATTRQVADFYEVKIDSVAKLVMRNREELDSDGMYILTRKEIALKGQDVRIENTPQVTTITDDLGGKHKFSNRGSRVFPRRAILRVGMLLRDSEVAKEVRTQLLNIEEKAAEDVKVSDITDEQTLLLGIISSETPEERAVALAEYRLYTRRHTEKVEAKLAEVETENELLSKTFTNWTPREVIRKLSNAIAGKRQCHFGSPLNEAYTELFYKHGINVRNRVGSKVLVERLNDSEQRLLVGILAATCGELGIKFKHILDNME